MKGRRRDGGEKYRRKTETIKYILKEKRGRRKKEGKKEGGGEREVQDE